MHSHEHLTVITVFDLRNHQQGCICHISVGRMSGHRHLNLNLSSLVNK